jgi:23S rRNA pseudouridine1911/1915/1917 synthase
LNQIASLVDASVPHILFDSGPLFAVWKPPGLATQAPPQFPSLELQMKDWLRAREGKTGNVYLGVPHRLDRPVSGVILFTRHDRAARSVSRQLERRQVQKIYWACVAGFVTPDDGTWTDYLRKIYGRPQTEVVAADAPGAQIAVLRYRTLARVAAAEGVPATWLEIELETGRTHQIRVQAGSRGHAVLGDAAYGSPHAFGPQTFEPRERHIALHSRRIRLAHPKSREPVDVTAPLPDSWRPLGLPTLGAGDFLPTPAHGTPPAGPDAAT